MLCFCWLCGMQRKNSLALAEDINSPCGFVRSLISCMRIRPGGLLTAGIVCSSWVTNAVNIPPMGGTCYSCYGTPLPVHVLEVAHLDEATHRQWGTGGLHDGKLELWINTRGKTWYWFHIWWIMIKEFPYHMVAHDQTVPPWLKLRCRAQISDWTSFLNQGGWHISGMQTWWYPG